MRPNLESEKIGLEEFFSIINKYCYSFDNGYLGKFVIYFSSSFMIIEQPHCGGIPVTICQGSKTSGHSADIKVTIVSLLHDFIQQHPEIIELMSISQ
jgi:hypothetical protein